MKGASVLCHAVIETTPTAITKSSVSAPGRTQLS